jgi:hypothetical protein
MLDGCPAQDAQVGPQSDNSTQDLRLAGHLLLMAGATLFQARVATFVTHMYRHPSGLRFLVTVLQRCQFPKCLRTSLLLQCLRSLAELCPKLGGRSWTRSFVQAHGCVGGSSSRSYDEYSLSQVQGLQKSDV